MSCPRYLLRLEKRARIALQRKGAGRGFQARRLRSGLAVTQAIQTIDEKTSIACGCSRQCRTACSPADRPTELAVFHHPDGGPALSGDDARGSLRACTVPAPTRPDRRLVEICGNNQGILVERSHRAGLARGPGWGAPLTATAGKRAILSPQAHGPRLGRELRKAAYGGTQ